MPAVGGNLEWSPFMPCLSNVKQAMPEKESFDSPGEKRPSLSKLSDFQEAHL